MPAAPAAAPIPAPTPKAPAGEEPKKEEKKETAAPATIQVSLPANATLTIDGAATRSTSANRTFATPTLETGKEYYYSLTAEYVRDGQTVTATKRVAVRAGAESRVNFEAPEAVAAK
jgi:uncharacterized protein (TIGR03000 family)